MSRTYPVGACWCPKCNRPGDPNGEDDCQPVAAGSRDPWGDVA